mgnify:CR=1 FL=1
MFKNVRLPFSIVVITLLLASCMKDTPNQTFNCWYLVDSGYITGNPICNKTRAEMYETYGGQYFFVNINEAWFCWKLIDGLDTIYRRNVTQSMVDSLFTPFAIQSAQVQCNSFCKWKVLFRSKNNVNGAYGPDVTRIITFTGASADTCSTLTPGRVVTILSTLDTLYTATYLQEMD